MDFTVQVRQNGQIVPGMIPGVPTTAMTPVAAFLQAVKIRKNTQKPCKCKKQLHKNSDEAFEECFGHPPDKGYLSDEDRVAILECFLKGQ